MTATNGVDARLPTGNALTAGLADVFGVSVAAVTVLDRRPNPYSTSSPTEIVICRIGGGSPRSLFIKHQPPDAPAGHGHRAGVVYEAMVYRSVLTRIGMRTPTYFGTFEGRDGRVAIVMDWLADAVRIRQSRHPEAMPRAARWLAELHVRGASIAERPPSDLATLDLAYYRGWVERTLALATPARVKDWLGRLCEHAATEFEQFDREPGTVIHGEFYPDNVLVHNARVYPVDWETAAIAPGEIDLAALTDGWPTNVATECEREYVRARWPHGPPEGFARRLDLARLHLLFRWLGDRPEWTSDDRASERYERLLLTGNRLRADDPMWRDAPTVARMRGPR